MPVPYLNICKVNLSVGQIVFSSLVFLNWKKIGALVQKDLEHLVSESDSRLITCLRAGVEESAGRLDGHRGQSAVGDLGARVAAAPRPRELVRLTRLAAEVAASDHLLGG